MKNYKLLTVLFTVILSTFTLCANIHAIENRNYENDSGFLIVIRDCDGNVVETYAQSRFIYVNGTQYNIPAGGSLTTYQYEPSTEFSAGFYFTNTSYSGDATTANRSIKITIENSSTIGGSRSDVVSRTFSTNLKDNPDYRNIYDGKMIALSVSSISGSRPYYDAKYENMSSQSATVSLFFSAD